MPDSSQTEHAGTPDTQRTTSLREGFTTGTAAAAAAQAALYYLLEDIELSQVEVSLPQKGSLSVPIFSLTKKGGEVQCAVIKDAGDDPDITHGMRICCTLRELPSDDPIKAETEAEAVLIQEVSELGITVYLAAGEGVGTVTLPGLGIPVGKPAINPVPQEMIAGAIADVCRAAKMKDTNFLATISLPGGAEVAKQTFNPRLGIKGGLSIIGTTGIVRPMSAEAMKQAITKELDVKQACGEHSLALTFGARGTKTLESTLEIQPDRIVQMSNFVGHTVKEAAKKGLSSLLIAGQVGKLVKVAAGMLDTHNASSSGKKAREEVIIASAKTQTGDQAFISELETAVTAQRCLELCEASGIDVASSLVERAQEVLCDLLVADDLTCGPVDIHVVLLTTDDRIAAGTQGADDLIRSLQR